MRTVRSGDGGPQALEQLAQRRTGAQARGGRGEDLRRSAGRPPRRSRTNKATRDRGFDDGHGWFRTSDRSRVRRLPSRMSWTGFASAARSRAALPRTACGQRRAASVGGGVSLSPCERCQRGARPAGRLRASQRAVDPAQTRVVAVQGPQHGEVGGRCAEVIERGRGAAGQDRLARGVQPDRRGVRVGWQRYRTDPAYGRTDSVDADQEPPSRDARRPVCAVARGPRRPGSRRRPGRGS